MQKHLQVPIQLPYYTYGSLTPATKNIWMVCHGQGQLAEYFLKKFEVLDSSENFVIAPQGVSKYYLNGLAGRVGATWMTSYDRLTEIANQQVLLRSIWDKEVGDSADRQVILFGFSQGTATITRFAAHSKLSFHKMVLWAGSFAHDLEAHDFTQLIGKEEVTYFTSREDVFFEEKMIQQQKDRVQSAMGIDPEVVFYEGGHKVIPELLPSILD